MKPNLMMEYQKQTLNLIKAKVKTQYNIPLVKFTDQLANQIKKINEQDFKKKEIDKRLISLLDKYFGSKKLVDSEKLFFTNENLSQKIQTILKVCFIGQLQWIRCNIELISNSIDFIHSNINFIDSEINDQLTTELSNLQSQLEGIIKELNFIKDQPQEKKHVRFELRYFTNRQPICSDIYELLISAVKGKNYQAARLKVALCLLTITGIRINELLHLKIYQIEQLIHSYWIDINRSKLGPFSHKAFLNPEGKRILKDRQRDLEVLFCMKKSNSYIFTPSRNHDKPLRRESITRSINNVLSKVSQQLPNKPNITSHSFRIGYITQLWKDPKDIEFVKETLKQIKVDSTSTYIENLSDTEKQERILYVKSTNAK